MAASLPPLCTRLLRCFSYVLEDIDWVSASRPRSSTKGPLEATDE